MGPKGTKAPRSAMAAIADHETQVFDRLVDGLAAIDGVRLVGAPARRTPTVAFTVDGRTPQQVSAALGERGVAVWAGNYYAVELMTALGLEDRGGAVRAGVVCYTTDEEVDRLLTAVQEAL